jgi:hypothetical protein
MKKHAFPMIFLALAAFLAFLAACGEGEPSNIATQWGPIQKAINDLTGDSGPIAKCVGKEDSEGCAPFPQLPPSSSSTDPDEPEPGNSSPYEPPPVSQGGGDDTSSDSQPPPPPVEGENCPDEVKAEIQGKFNCSWDPASVISGDDATLKMQISDASCTAGKAQKQLTCGFYSRYAYFGVDEKIPAAGVYKDIPNPANCDDASKSWPPSGSFVVNGMLSCDIQGTKYTCSKPCAPLAINPAPKPEKTGSMSCTWPYLTAKNLAIGATIPDCNVNGITITNKEDSKAGCGDVTYELSGSTTAAGTVKGYAVATCRKTKHYLDSNVATVVPNPSLSGTCSWTANDVAVTGITSKAKSIKPTGVSLSNSYGRCGSLADGALLPNAFGGTGADTWPSDGKLTITTNTTYSDVKTKVNCTPAVQAVTCPALTVNVGCDVMLTSTNIVTVPKNGCLDLEYTIPADLANGAKSYLICTNGGNMGPQSLKCNSKMTYGTTVKTNEQDCNVGIGNNPGNSKVVVQLGSKDAGDGGKKVEQVGITFSVTTNKKIECIIGTVKTATPGCMNSAVYYFKDNKMDYYPTGCVCSSVNDDTYPWNRICNGPTEKGFAVDSNDANKEFDVIQYSGCTVSGYATTPAGSSNIETTFQCKVKNGTDDNW